MRDQETNQQRGYSVCLAVFFLLISALSSGRPAECQTDTISGPAYQLINQRATANRESFLVYLDQDSGFNHGFPSGFMGTDPGTISLNTGCIDDGSSATGCSTNPNVLDQVHGTVLSISFGAQTPGNWAGVALEEPQGWLGLQYGTGYNLTGVTSVTFQVRSPNGAQVQYGVGGCVTPFTAPIPSTWTTVSLALDTTSLSCTPDLTNLHLLFEVVTNDYHAPNGATVLLDNIRFTPVPAVQQSALSFPLANQTFGVVPRQVPPIPPDQVLRNLTTIYESSLTELTLLARGTAQDRVNAKLIADTFDYALHHDSHGDPVPVAPGGYVGLHNGYENGDIALFNNQPAPLLGQAGDILLAGFTDTSLCAPSGYCLVLDGSTGGNNAFAILALVAAYDQFGDVRYLNDAVTIGDWIVGNLEDSTGTGYGGYFAGYPDEGVPPPKPPETGKSIENNADIFAAFTALASVESWLGNSSAAVGWTSAANVAGDFVMQMFDSTNGRFYVGTVPPGTKSAAGICPTGPQKGNDVINVCDFLDSDTFTTLAMAGTPRYQNQIDWRKPIQYVLNNFAQSVTAGGITYKGFDIVPTPDSGSNGVAWEFTGQAVEAMRYVDKLYGVTTFESPGNNYLDQIAQAQASAPFGDGLGLVAATLQDGDTLPPLEQCLQTPYQCIAERVGLAATSWAILAEQKLNIFNPFPIPTLSSTSLSFSAQPVTTSSASQAVTLSNTGNVALLIGSISVSGADASSFVFANSCGTILAAGASCTIHGHFAPTAAGAQTAAVTITDNATGSPQSIALTGAGVTSTTVSLSAKSLAFGNVLVGATTASQSVTLTNTGSVTLSIGSISVTGTGAASFTFGNTCGSSLAAGANCTIHGHFAPAAAGAYTAAATITDNATGSP